MLSKAGDPKNPNLGNSSARSREQTDYAEPGPSGIQHAGSTDSVSSMKPMGVLDPPPRVSALNIQELVKSS